jgi:hypothetical protein
MMSWWMLNEDGSSSTVQMDKRQLTQVSNAAYHNTLSQGIDCLAIVLAWGHIMDIARDAG